MSLLIEDYSSSSDEEVKTKITHHDSGSAKKSTQASDSLGKSESVKHKELVGIDIRKRKSNVVLDPDVNLPEQKRYRSSLPPGITAKSGIGGGQTHTQPKKPISTKRTPDAEALLAGVPDSFDRSIKEGKKFNTNIEYQEINQKDLVDNVVRGRKRKGPARESSIPEFRGRPTRLQRSRNQMTSLLYFAKAKEFELIDKKEEGKVKRGLSRQKYGW